MLQTFNVQHAGFGVSFVAQCKSVRRIDFVKRVSSLLSALSMVFGLALLTISAHGQRRFAEKGPDNAYKFTPQAQTVIDRLATFSSIPDQDWQYHVGDVPHGERPDLDTSGWQTVQFSPRSPFTAPADAVWFRRSIEVPKTVNGYDISGAQVWFQMGRSRGESIVYFNGSRVALGESLEKQLLFSNAHPGDKILVAVKMLGTPEPKRLFGFRLDVVFAGNRPNPEDLRDELLSASFLLPTITPDANTLASQEKTLDTAATSVDLSALDKGDQSAFDASMKQSQSTLEALRPVLQAYDVHMTGNSHIDAAWLWPWTETVDVVHRTFGTALQLMDEYPTYTYTQSALQY